MPAFARAALWQAGAGALPLVRAAHDEPERAPEWDRRAEVTLVSAVARRASSTQGRAWLLACEAAFGAVPFAEAVRARRTPGHFAVAFGVTLRAAEVARADAERLYLHQTLRGVLSAAVRLGRLGPLEAQAVQAGLAAAADQVMATCAGLGPDEVAQVAPLEELWGMLHDRLYSRLFQS